MLIDDIIKVAGHAPKWIMRNVTPYILHLMPPDTKDSAVRKLAAAISSVSDGVSLVYPTCNRSLFPGYAQMRLNHFHTIGMTVDPIYISHSPTGKCMEPIGQDEIPIGRRLFDSLAAIHPTITPSVDMFYSVTYEAAMLSYDDTSENNFIKIYRSLGRLTQTIPPGAYYTFGEIYRNSLLDYLDFRDMMLSAYGLDRGISGIAGRGDMPDEIVNKFVNTLLLLSNCDSSTPPGSVTDLATGALVLERLIAWMLTSEFNVLSKVRGISETLIRRLKLSPEIPVIQQLIAQSAVIASELVSGDTTWANKFLSDVVGSKNTIASNCDTDCKPVDTITARYICGWLSDYIEDLSPEDISFDIPEERLAMLVHDLGSKKFKITAEGNGYVHYYREDGEPAYKLFMAKDSARIVYGISNTDGKVNLIRFSDGSPKFDYVYTY